MENKSLTISDFKVSSQPLRLFALRDKLQAHVLKEEHKILD